KTSNEEQHVNTDNDDDDDDDDDDGEIKNLSKHVETLSKEKITTTNNESRKV
ncbi:unnamed protein product, partial [Rotaria magnacalcarata]